MANVKKKKKKLTPEEKALRNKKRIENYNPIMAARNALRREFSRSPIVIEMMNENKRYVPRYKANGDRHAQDSVEHLCACCKQWKKSTKDKKFAIDHINPVVDPDVGFIDLNTYYERMFVGREKLNKLCFECHSLKTNAERLPRRLTEYRQTLKELSNIEDFDILRKKLKPFNKKRLSECTEDILESVERLKQKLILIKNINK